MWIVNKSFTAIVVLLIIALFSVEASAEKSIGILLWSEAERFISAQNGVLYQLKKDGFGEPAVKYTIENAMGNKAKAAELARKFAAAKMDLIVTLGTPATVVTKNEIKDVPIVFTMVYDAVEAGIAREMKSSGNNTTGVNTGTSMLKLMDSLKKFKTVKKLAVLYTPNEKQTAIQFKELQEAGSQIKVVPVLLTNKEEVSQILSEVVKSADALYLTGSSIVVATTPVIMDIAIKAKVVTITHIEELIEKGALLGVCPNAYLVGRQAGAKAVKILRGAKPSSLALERGEKLDIILNKKTAQAGQFQIPPEFMKTVTKTIE